MGKWKEEEDTKGTVLCEDFDRRCSERPHVGLGTFLGTPIAPEEDKLYQRGGKEEENTVRIRRGEKRYLSMSKSENIFSVSPSARLHTISCIRIQLLSFVSINANEIKKRNENKK